MPKVKRPLMQLVRKFRLTKKRSFILLFLILGSVVALLTNLNDLDSNLHLDYVRDIQESGVIPIYHPHLFQSNAAQAPFPYPLGYHLAMAALPHWVSLYKVLGVVFAGVSLILVIKLHKLFGFGRNIAVITPLVLSLSFSRFTIIPHSDMFALMLVLLSTYATLRYILDGKSVYIALAVGSGFYASMTREIALMTLLFVWLVLWFKYNNQRTRLFQVLIPIILLTGLGYYLVNPVLRGTNLLYPLQGLSDPNAYGWYMSHLSFWSILAHGYFLQVLGIIVVAFTAFIPLFLTKPQDRTLALVFGSQIMLIFILMPSVAGLARYIMFTLPFLAIAYGNIFKNYKRWLPVLFVGILIVYPAQGLHVNARIPNDFDNIAHHIDENDFVLTREQAQLAYRIRCRAGWTSLFWSGDLYDTFENVEKLENFITKHGVTHVLIDKGLITPADSPMIGEEAVKYPQDWVNKVESIGLKIDETKHYILYEV
ncbi:hypothetical protein ES703_02696 [subsurface metagenome]